MLSYDGEGYPTEMGAPSAPHKSTPISAVYAKFMATKCRSRSRVTLTAGDKTIVLVHTNKLC